MPAHQTVTPIIIVQMHPNVRRDLARLHQLDHEHGGAAFPMYYLYSLQTPPEARNRAAPAVLALPAFGGCSFFAG
jgi:hypothetical protein